MQKETWVNQIISAVSFIDTQSTNQKLESFQKPKAPLLVVNNTTSGRIKFLRGHTARGAEGQGDGALKQLPESDIAQGDGHSSAERRKGTGEGEATVSTLWGGLLRMARERGGVRGSTNLPRRMAMCDCVTPRAVHAIPPVCLSAHNACLHSPVTHSGTGQMCIASGVFFIKGNIPGTHTTETQPGNRRNVACWGFICGEAITAHEGQPSDVCFRNRHRHTDRNCWGLGE